jgi:transcriptional regulator with GAF, ATPase, and Fis domain
MNLIRIKMGDIEKEVILQTLHRNNWDKAKAAEELGLTLQELVEEMNKLGVDVAKKPRGITF